LRYNNTIRYSYEGKNICTPYEFNVIVIVINNRKFTIILSIPYAFNCRKNKKSIILTA
jgi:hypothetical protein